MGDTLTKRMADSFKKKYGKDHIYSKAWDHGFKTKVKNTTIEWHDKKVIEGWMKIYIRTHEKDSTSRWF